MSIPPLTPPLVSILILMDVCLKAVGLSLLGSGGVVSILILMDVCLKVPYLAGILDAPTMFQSLF